VARHDYGEAGIPVAVRHAVTTVTASPDLS